MEAREGRGEIKGGERERAWLSSIAESHNNNLSEDIDSPIHVKENGSISIKQNKDR